MRFSSLSTRAVLVAMPASAEASEMSVPRPKGSQEAIFWTLGMDCSPVPTETMTPIDRPSQRALAA